MGKFWASFDFITDKTFEPDYLHTGLTVNLGSRQTTETITSQASINYLNHILSDRWAGIELLNYLPDFETTQDWWKNNLKSCNGVQVIKTVVARLADTTPLTWYEKDACERLNSYSTDSKTLETELLGYLWKIYAEADALRVEDCILSESELSGIKNNFYQTVLPGLRKQSRGLG